MGSITYRIVLDTNVLLRSLVAGASPAAKVRRAAEERLFIPLLSKPVLDEYRDVLSDGALVERFTQITPELVELTVRRLRYVSDYIRSPGVRFEYRRDPLDQKFLELAIALKATHILSYDKDLLSLPLGRTQEGRRYRQRLAGVQVLEAGEFLRKYESMLRL